MSKYTIILLILSLLWIYLGLKTLLNDYKNKINIIFSLQCLSLVYFYTFFTAIYSLTNIEEVTALAKLSFIGAYFFFPLNLHFNFTITKTKIRTWYLILCYLPALSLAFVNILGYSYISEMIKYNGEWVAVLDLSSVWLQIYNLFILITFLISFFIIFKWGRQTKLKKEKMYSRYTLISFAITEIVAWVTTILLPMKKIYHFQVLGVVLFNLYGVGLFFLISKLRFMDIRKSLMAGEIISNLNDMVILLDEKLKITEFNSKFNEIFSIFRMEDKKKNYAEFIIENKEFNDNIWKLKENKISNFAMQLNYKNGADFIITKTYISRIQDKFGDPCGFLVISSEIKEIRQFQNYFKITNRELEIIEFIISGSTYKEVSAKLSIAEKTVETHLTNIYNKIGINNKIELIIVALDFNILPADMRQPSNNIH